ncbi:rhodopsin, G0-coupled-like [Liolophura sinensis]|uniref:rhodopsin, G0-coupled-like n=1 Tax=Liolophura sinensis TaxID=3198878 RepID=UPI003159906F
MMENSSIYANLSEYQMSYTAYLGTGIYVAFVGILSTFGNLIVIVVICGKRKEINFQKKQHIPLLLNLAVADIGVSLFGYPYTSLSGMAGRWLFTDELCTMAAFFCFLLSLVSLSSLVVVSIIRYIVICKPGLKPRLTSRMINYTVLLTWLYGVAWAVIPLFGPAAYTYEMFGTSCSINWTRGLLQDTIFIICIDVFCFLIPLAIIATCYVQIILRYRMISAPSTTGYDNSDGFTKMKARRDMRVTWLVLVQVGSFITVWTPYVVVSGLSLVYSLPVWVTVLPTMFAKLSCAVNPITYSLLNRTFRRMSRDILCKCALRKVSHSSDKYRPTNR